MKQSDVDWDKLFSDITFKELRLSAPEFIHRRLPTCYSRERNFILLSSQDQEVGTQDEDTLRKLLKDTKESYSQSLKRSPIDVKTAYLAQVDFFALCEILYTLTADEDFGDPEFALNN